MSIPATPSAMSPDSPESERQKQRAGTSIQHPTTDGHIQGGPDGASDAYQLDVSRLQLSVGGVEAIFDARVVGTRDTLGGDAVVVLDGGYHRAFA